MRIARRLPVLYVLSMVGIVCSLCSPVSAQELPDNFWAKSAPNKSDSFLTRARLVCSSGEMAHAISRSRSYGAKGRDTSTYCAAVVSETISRGQQMDVYVRMQPHDGAKEFRLVFDAASSNEPQYANANGVTKMLPCSLAYDAGAVYESIHPGELDVPNASTEELAELRARCFESSSNEPVVNGLIAGVLDQR